MTGQDHAPAVGRGAPHAVADPVEQVARSMAVTGLDVVIEVVPADPPTPGR